MNTCWVDVQVVYLLSERTGLYATSTWLGRNAIEARGERVALVLFVNAVAAHAVGTASEARRVDGIEGIFSPVPVLHERARHALMAETVSNSLVASLRNPNHCVEQFHKPKQSSDPMAENLQCRGWSMSG